MSNWRNEVLKPFKIQDNRLFLVHDPDYLFGDIQILNELKTADFDVLHYDDSITFRYLYERNYRDKPLNLVVISNNLVEFPYEFKKQAITLTIDLSQLFPKFSTTLLKSLGELDLDALFVLHGRYHGDSSRQETLSFLVEQYYKIPVGLMSSKAEIFKALISVYYRRDSLPIPIRNFLIDMVQVKGLPLKTLLESSASFYNYLNGQWSEFVSTYDGEIVEESIDSEDYPFINKDVWALVNDLFLDGTLKKAKKPNSLSIPSWMNAGIEYGGETSIVEINTLKNKIAELFIKAKGYKDWIELIQLASEIQDNEILKNINEKFQYWMLENYGMIVSLPPYPKPKMVHHIPDFLKSRHKEKTALLVLDGMSFYNWKQIRTGLKEMGFYLEENGVFAWVPSLTSVSRQAIFSGKIPLKFGDTIMTTVSEEKQWKNFWSENGIAKQYVSYQKGLGTNNYNREDIIGLKKSSIKIYGAVIDTIDQLLHGNILGQESLELSLNIWLKRGFLINLINDLMQAGFEVYLTSDHGNTTATGIGRFSEGVLTDVQGERVRIYENNILFEHSKVKDKGIVWNGVGLPESFYVIFSKDGEAFTTPGVEILTHGGINIEEVIVPFIKMIGGGPN